MRKIRKRTGLAIAIAAGALIGTLGVAAPASADGWATTLTCGTNYKCSMVSNTAGSVTYFIDGATKANFPTGGSHSWVGAISGGTHSVTMGTAGLFYSQSARCYCPPGVACGI